MRRLLIPLIGATTLLAPVGEAAAQDNTFTCRASLVRVVGEGPLAPLGTIEPVVANEQNNPCTTENAGLLNNLELPADLGVVSLLYARTNNQSGQRGTAAAGVADVLLTVPNLPVIRVEVLTAEAAATCTNGQPGFTSRSRVVGLNIGGTDIAIPPGHTDIPLGPLGMLHLNETITGDNSITQRALWLDTTVADVIIAEAIADYRGNPCTGEPPCPPGEVRDTGTGQCVPPCPDGSAPHNGQCPQEPCPEGKVRDTGTGECVPPCPDGSAPHNGQCDEDPCPPEPEGRASDDRGALTERDDDDDDDDGDDDDDTTCPTGNTTGGGDATDTGDGTGDPGGGTTGDSTAGNNTGGSTAGDGDGSDGGTSDDGGGDTDDTSGDGYSGDGNTADGDTGDGEKADAGSSQAGTTPTPSVSTPAPVQLPTVDVRPVLNGLPGLR